jgi:serine/threonine protein kinase/Flp pilus assembly protein TadD
MERAEMIGRTLSHFRILSLIGEGGMGVVYRAQDENLQRTVALKVLPPERLDDEERRLRFIREARTAAAVTHPNIATVYEVGEFEGAVFIAMELIEGQTLREVIGGKSLPPREALRLGVDIAEGLAAAHRAHVIHRDLKPENVIVTPDGRVKILDFGLAKQVAAFVSRSQSKAPTQDMARGTEIGAVLGTVGYMSPEQARGEPADSRTDLFSFGCVLYEMLGGRPAFKKDTAVETLNAILKEAPPSLASTSGAVPRAAERIVARCLEKRPEDRFASASDLHSALQSLLHSPALEVAAAAPPAKSIVVLPFENLSPDPENAYFADGLTEEIIADLSKVRSLLVISRTSAMHYKGTTKPLPVIAQELKVRYVLEGSVRRAGNNLRITAQLIEAATDGHLWAEKYAGTLDDVFDMQEKVSRAIVDALKVELTPQEDRRLADRPIPSAYAFECYLKARREIWRFDASSVERGMEYLEQGLRALPDNPMLLAGMAYAHFQRVNIGVEQESGLREAEALATRALGLDPGLLQGHLVLALIAMWRRGGIRTAVDHFERALTADPSDLDALTWAGSIFSFVGRLAEGASLGEKALAIDPMSPASHLPLVFSHWLNGRFESALQVMERACRLDPGSSTYRVLTVFLLIPSGKREEAFALAAQAEKEGQPNVVHRLAILWRYALEGDREKALSWMPAEALETCRRDLQWSFYLACAYAMLGDDDALGWLENAVELGFLNHRYLGEIDPILAPLRVDPRFQALMARARKLQAELEASP